MFNTYWLPWLPSDAITNIKNYQYFYTALIFWGNTKIRNKPKPPKMNQNKPNNSETSQIIAKRPIKKRQIIAKQPKTSQMIAKRPKKRAKLWRNHPKTTQNMAKPLKTVRKTSRFGPRN